MKAEKEHIFIKLGGSAITFKDTPNKANTQVIERAAREISETYKDKKILIGHGGGSFPHVVAEKYKVQEGIKKCGLKGFAETQKAARTLNQIVVDSLVNAGVPAIPIQTSACTFASGGSIKEIYTEPIQEFIKLGMVPVIYGDVIFDEVKGCTIASTEMIFRELALKLRPTRLIIGADVGGVFSKDPKEGKGTLIEEIDQDNLHDVLKMLSEPKVNDVTGGMPHKIKELYNLSKLNIKIQIISLLKDNNLKKAIQGEKVPGTRIEVYES